MRMDLKGCSISAPTLPTLLCENLAESCDNVLCECLEAESYGEYSKIGEESEESFEGIYFKGEDEPKKKLSLWETILEEFREERRGFDEWERKQDELKSEEITCEIVEYLNKKIFPVLLPGMEKMLREARKWNAIEDYRCRFNGVDYLAEYLWNRNPEHPQRQFNWIGVFEIPEFRRWLRANPRPIYPKSWLWSKKEAASIIQKNVRGWIVRKREDVQELRQFWKALAAERAERGSSISSFNLDDFEILSSKNKETFDICRIFK